MDDASVQDVITALQQIARRHEALLPPHIRRAYTLLAKRSLDPWGELGQQYPDVPALDWLRTVSECVQALTGLLLREQARSRSIDLTLVKVRRHAEG